VPEFVRAALSLAQEDTALALRRFLAFPDSVCTHASQLGAARFRLLVATGRSAEAAVLFDRSDIRSVLLVLERARLAERAHDPEAAAKYYRFVVDAWMHADPELQETVAEARSALARVAGKTQSAI
jgi:hypothetical protein